MPSKLRLLSIGHSYCVDLNRRLPHWIAKLGSPRWEVVACAPEVFPGDLSPIRTRPESYELCEVRTLPVHLTRDIHLFFYGMQLRKLLADDWAIVHMWEEPFILAAGQIAALLPKRIPLVYYTCQNLTRSYPPPFGQIEKFCFRRASGWLAMGQTTLDAQLQRGFGSKPCAIVAPCVDTDHFHPDQNAAAASVRRLGWDEPHIPVVGFAGRFVPEKGISLLMSALSELTIPWRAIFLGGGPLLPVIESWAKRYRDRVRVVTGIPHREVPAYINAMDVLCVPSQTARRWREQFGRVIAEALSCEVPVIGSDSGEIPYVIGDAGIVAGEDDQRGWVNALELLLGDAGRRRELGRLGRERALKLYSCAEVARQHIQFFERMLDRAPGSTLAESMQ